MYAIVYSFYAIVYPSHAIVNMYDNPTINIIISVRLSYQRKSPMEKDEEAKILANKIDRLAISIIEGNTDQVGRGAWSGFFEEIEKAITSFVNQTHWFYDTCNLGPRITEFERQLAQHQAELQQIDTSLTQLRALRGDAVTQAVKNDILEKGNKKFELEGLIRTFKRDISGMKFDVATHKDYKERYPNLFLKNLPAIAHTKTLNNGYDITYGYVSTQVKKEEWKKLFNKASQIRKPVEFLQTLVPDTLNDLLGEEPRANYIVRQPLDADTRRHFARAQETLNSKESVRTISSTMDNLSWSTCTQHPNCRMPNTKRTADIAICIIPDKPETSLTIPIWQGEVLGRKPKESKNEELFQGLVSSCQGLVFSPRTYYWEIDETESRMFILQKNPANGAIDIAKKTYDLTKLGPQGRRPQALTDLITDTSKCLLDSLINLRPISAYSAKALYDANYREFLSSVLEGGRKIDIQTHCWHLFTPKFKGQDEKKTRLASHLQGDYEDPEKTSNPHPDFVNFRERPEEYPAAMRATVVPVGTEELNYEDFDTAFLQDLPLNRAIRDEFGEPLPPDLGNIRDVRIGATIALKVAHHALEAFARKIVHGEFSIYREYLAESIHNLTQLGRREVGYLSIDEEAIVEEELEAEEQDVRERLARIDIIATSPDEHFLRMVRSRNVGDGTYGCEYIDRDVIIRGPKGNPFTGGFAILSSGDLVYMPVLGRVQTIPGFNGCAVVGINDVVSAFLEKMAYDLGDGQHRRGGGNGGDDGNGQPPDDGDQPDNRPPGSGDAPEGPPRPQGEDPPESGHPPPPEGGDPPPEGGHPPTEGGHPPPEGAEPSTSAEPTTTQGTTTTVQASFVEIMSLDRTSTPITRGGPSFPSRISGIGIPVMSTITDLPSFHSTLPPRDVTLPPRDVSLYIRNKKLRFRIYDSVNRVTRLRMLYLLFPILILFKESEVSSTTDDPPPSRTVATRSTATFTQSTADILPTIAEEREEDVEGNYRKIEYISKVITGK